MEFLEWGTKYISLEEWWYVIKKFKPWFKFQSIEELKKDLELKKKVFGKFIPETLICEDENWWYFIKQKFIEWKTLSDTNLYNLSSDTIRDLIDLIDKYFEYHNKYFKIIDISWYQGKYTNKLIKKLSSLYDLKDNFLISTNIIVSETWEVFLVDVLDIKGSFITKIRREIKLALAIPFINNTLRNLRIILSKKR